MSLFTNTEIRMLMALVNEEQGELEEIIACEEYSPCIIKEAEDTWETFDNIMKKLEELLDEEDN